MKCQFEIGSPVVIHRHNGRTDEPSVRPASALNTTDGNCGHSRHSSSSCSSSDSTTTAAASAAGTKFTVTRVMEASDPIACAGSGGGVVYTAATGAETQSATAVAADLDEPCSSLDSSTSDSFKHINDDLDTVPKRFGAKNRLVSVDSGFESIGKMRVIAAATADADSTLAEDRIIDEESGDILEALRGEDERLNNNDAPAATAAASTTTTATATSATGTCDIRHKSGGATVAVKKNRTTTINAAPENDSLLDPMLINKSDGLQDVLYYIDENGSPKIREKFTSSKKSRFGKKQSASEAKKKRKQLTYGTEADIADAYAFDEKTPSCVSFSRICKRFRNSFRKWHHISLANIHFVGWGV